MHSAGARLGEDMVSKAQIDRIATRIEALAPKSDRVVYVWRNRGKPKKRSPSGTTASSLQIDWPLRPMSSVGNNSPRKALECSRGPRE